MPKGVNDTQKVIEIRANCFQLLDESWNDWAKRSEVCDSEILASNTYIYGYPWPCSGHFVVILCTCLKWPLTQKLVAVERNRLKFGTRGHWCHVYGWLWLCSDKSYKLSFHMHLNNSQPINAPPVIQPTNQCAFCLSANQSVRLLSFQTAPITSMMRTGPFAAITTPTPSLATVVAVGTRPSPTTLEFAAVEATFTTLRARMGDSKVAASRTRCTALSPKSAATKTGCTTGRRKTRAVTVSATTRRYTAAVPTRCSTLTKNIAAEGWSAILEQLAEI